MFIDYTTDNDCDVKQDKCVRIILFSGNTKVLKDFISVLSS